MSSFCNSSPVSGLKKSLRKALQPAVFLDQIFPADRCFQERACGSDVGANFSYEGMWGSYDSPQRVDFVWSSADEHDIADLIEVRPFHRQTSLVERVDFFAQSGVGSYVLAAQGLQLMGER